MRVLYVAPTIAEWKVADVYRRVLIQRGESSHTDFNIVRAKNGALQNLSREPGYDLIILGGVPVPKRFGYDPERLSDPLSPAIDVARAALSRGIRTVAFFDESEVDEKRRLNELGVCTLYFGQVFNEVLEVIAGQKRDSPPFSRAN